MSPRYKIVFLTAVALLASVVAGIALHAETPEEPAEDVKSLIAPPVYLGCRRHGFAVREESGITHCVVCGEELTALPPDTAVRLSGAFGRLSIQGEELGAAGVTSEPVERRELFTQVRTVGTVAAATAVTAAAAAEAPSSTAWIYAEVRGPESRWVGPGSELRITAGDVPGWIWEGKMSRVQPRYDSVTRTLRFRVEVEDPDFQLKPEMQVDVTIRSLYLSPFLATMVLAVPQEALFEAGDQRFVWVDQGGGDFEMRKLILDPFAKEQRDGAGREYYPVMRGLSEGERVVTRAAFKK